MAIFQSFWHGPELASVRPNVHEVVSGRAATNSTCTPTGSSQSRSASRSSTQTRSCRNRACSITRTRTEQIGSVAAFANLFRYCLLEKKGGWWVDADVLRLDAPLPRGELVLGKEDDVLVCNAIMKAPAGHHLDRPGEAAGAGGGNGFDLGANRAATSDQARRRTGDGAVGQAPRRRLPHLPAAIRFGGSRRGKGRTGEVDQGRPVSSPLHEMFRSNADPRLNAPEQGSFLFDLYAFHKPPGRKADKSGEERRSHASSRRARRLRSEASFSGHG